MKNLTLPIIRKMFVEKLGKTAIELANGITVFANGDVTSDQSILCHVVVNEVGDTFTATRDSNTMSADGKTPLYKKGQVVTRQKQSVEFKGFAGNNAPAQFAQAASAYGLQLQVVMH